MLLSYLLLRHLRLFICKLSALHGSVLNTQVPRALAVCSSLAPVCALLPVAGSAGGKQPRESAPNVLPDADLGFSV